MTDTHTIWISTSLMHAGPHSYEWFTLQRGCSGGCGPAQIEGHTLQPDTAQWCWRPPFLLQKNPVSLPLFLSSHPASSSALVQSSSCCTTYIKRFHTPSGKWVDVVHSPSNNPIMPLCFFWSTTIMNFLTPDSGVCGFPSTTFRCMGVLKLGAMQSRDTLALCTYEGGEYKGKPKNSKPLTDKVGDNKVESRWVRQ